LTLPISVDILDEMKERARVESEKREPHIRHHFDIEHYDSFARNVIGFLGEFAGCVMLGLEWKANIRPNYFTIDKLDAVYYGKRLDIKTETIPEPFFSRVVTKEIDDDELYGRRLYHTGQVRLLQKYDIIIFGAIERLCLPDIKQWFAVGWIEADKITMYPHGQDGPNGIRYPFPAFQVRTSDLRDIPDLLKPRA
jgi:hypothetical protein